MTGKDAEAAKAKRQPFPGALSHIREVGEAGWRAWLEIAGEPQPRPRFGEVPSIQVPRPGPIILSHDAHYRQVREECLIPEPVPSLLARTRRREGGFSHVRHDSL